MTTGKMYDEDRKMFLRLDPDATPPSFLQRLSLGAWIPLLEGFLYTEDGAPLDTLGTWQVVKLKQRHDSAPLQVWLHRVQISYDPNPEA